MATDYIMQAAFRFQRNAKPIITAFDVAHASSDGWALLLKALNEWGCRTSRHTHAGLHTAFTIITGCVHAFCRLEGHEVWLPGPKVLEEAQPPVGLQDAPHLPSRRMRVRDRGDNQTRDRSIINKISAK